jgi:hypothetical protein
MIFVAIWMGLVALLVVTVKRKDVGPPTPAPGYVEKTAGPTEEDQWLINKNFSSCTSHLQEFMAAPDAAARSLHVLRSSTTIARMARYYGENPSATYTGEMRLDSHHVIHTPVGPAIETAWQLGEDQQIEAVFFEEAGDWKIDWDAFVRFNTEPWALFLSAQGPVEGVFRVLARERIGAAGKNDEYIGLVLGVPRPGHPGEITSPSPEIKVPRASEMGVKIEQAFKARENGLGTFESIVVKNDPAEMIRLRVRVTREGEEERQFKITELLGTHWLEIDEAAIKAE